MAMRIIELHPASALEALAAEEAVLEAVNAGEAEPAWISWTAPSRCAVLGTSRPAAGDLFLERLRADGVPVLRRRSGGGTVLLGPESPAVAMIARREASGSPLENPSPYPLPQGERGDRNATFQRAAGSIRESYLAFCEVLVAVLARLGVTARFEPPADLAAGNRKVAGLAQRRKRAAVLVGACVLAEPLAAAAARGLREPAAADSPAYRAGRAHGEFMTSLAEAGCARPAEDWRRALREELIARGAVAGRMAPIELSRAPELAAELARPEWVHRF